jgi:hypothetical protein
MQPFVDSAAWYDALYAARGKDYAREASQVASLVELQVVPMAESYRPEARTDERATLIDFACGTGEHLRFLRDHFDVMGVDACPSMLAVAQRKLSGVTLIHGDMCTVNLGRQADAAVSLFSSVGYLPDEAALGAAIATMAAHVRPGGVVIVEPAVLRERVQPARPQVTEITWNGERIVRTTTAVREGNVLRIRFTFSCEGIDGRRVVEEEHRIQLFARSMYYRAFSAAGLRVKHEPSGSTGLGMFIGCRPA